MFWIDYVFNSSHIFVQFFGTFAICTFHYASIDDCFHRR
jgi:hypothetical protein